MPRVRSRRAGGTAALSADAAGILYAAAAALIMAATIALSRLGVKTELAPADLLALRFGIGAVIFLPVLVHTWSRWPVAARRAALPLSFAHGWGMAGCSLLGLSFAPASHAGALGPGLMPVFVAVLGVAIFGRRVAASHALGLAAIVAGVGILLAGSGSDWTSTHVLGGDALFAFAALLAAGYMLFVERHRVPALAGNAVVFALSGLIVIPAYVIAFDSNIPHVAPHDLAWQILFQGVLMPVAYVAVHHAVMKLGGARVTMIMAAVPVLTLVAGYVIAGDAVTAPDLAAVLLISAGILYAALHKDAAVSHATSTGAYRASPSTTMKPPRA